MSKKKKIILISVLSVVLALLVAAGVILMVIFFGPKKIADVSIENAGQSTLLQTDKSPDELTPEEVAYAFIYKMSNLQSYKLQSSGATVANIMGGYTQNVTDLGYKFGDEVYLQNISTSTFANVNHEAFVKTVNGVSKVAYRDNGGNISVSDRDGNGGYKSVYGISPDDLAIGGYIFNSSTIKSSERLEGSNRYQLKEEYANDLQYHFSIEVGNKDVHDEATAFAQLQMVQYGELSAAPVFSEIDLWLTISPEWEPRELITHTVYSTKKTMGVEMSLTCTQDITATYTQVNSIIENPIPDVADFNNAIGSLPSTEVQGGNNAATDEVTGVLMDVFNVLAGQKWSEGVKLGAVLDPNILSREESKILSKPFNFALYAKYNPEAIESGAYLNAVNFRLDGDIEGVSGILKLLNEIKEIIPEDKIPAYVTQMRKLSLCYTGNGYPAIVLKDGDGTPIFAHEIDLAEILLPMLGAQDEGEEGAGGSGGLNLGALKDLDITALMGKLKDIFTVEKRETGRALVLSKDGVKKLDEGYVKLLDTVAGLLAQGGNAEPLKGALYYAVGAEITSLEIKLSEADGEVKGISLEISGVPERKPAADGSSIPLLCFSLSFDGQMTAEELSSLAADGKTVKEFLKRQTAAQTYNGKVQTLIDEMWLGETYVRRVNALKAEIDALDPEIKAMVYKYSSLDKLIEEHNELKKQADEFIALVSPCIEGDDWSGFEKWADLKGLYDGKIETTRCQREYIGEEVIEKYLSAAAEAAATAANRG